MQSIVLTTTQASVPAVTIPAEAHAVTWRRVKGENVWHYRFHGSWRGATIVHSNNGKAYDAVNYAEWGVHRISDQDRKAGLWLW